MTSKLPYYDLFWVRAASDTRSEGMLKLARQITTISYPSLTFSISSLWSSFTSSSQKKESKKKGTRNSLGGEGQKKEKKYAKIKTPTNRTSKGSNEVEKKERTEDKRFTNSKEALQIQSFGNAYVPMYLLPRSRAVGQSWFSTPFTFLFSFFAAFRLVFLTQPDLILANGPGTCLPLILSAFLLRYFRFVYPHQCRIIYIESLCRVQELSLTGKILYYGHLYDRFLVQWPTLQEKYQRTEYIGQIC